MKSNPDIPNIHAEHTAVQVHRYHHLHVKSFPLNSMLSTLLHNIHTTVLELHVNDASTIRVDCLPLISNLSLSYHIALYTCRSVLVFQACYQGLGHILRYIPGYLWYKTTMLSSLTATQIKPQLFFVHVYSHLLQKTTCIETALGSDTVGQLLQCNIANLPGIIHVQLLVWYVNSVLHVYK